MWWGGGERKQLKCGGLGRGGGAKQQKNGFDEVPSKTKAIHRPKNNQKISLTTENYSASPFPYEILPQFIYEMKKNTMTLQTR